MSVMKYKDPTTGEVKKVGAPKIDTYTKTETDTLLQKKAESDSVYAKTETDALLANKAVFGLCEGIYNFNTKSELEAKLSELFYGMTEGSVRYWRFNMLAVFEPFGGGVWMLELTRLAEDHCIARMSDSGGKVLVLRKDGSWGVWEWVNPPLQLGVEYRTTERYRGKPVYQKLIDFGALPNNTQKSVSIFASGEANTMECGIDVKLISHANQAYKHMHTMTVQVLQTGGVTINSNYNLSGSSVYALCYYTKTTD